jgi:phosphatidylglycerol:prolipoprotein diacylglycerol transferase
MCDLPWAIQFPAGSPPYVRQLERGLMYGLQIGGESGASSDARPTPVVTAVSVALSAGHAGLKVGERIESVNGRATPTIDAARQELVDNFLAGREVLLKTDRNTYPLLPEPSMFERSLPVHPTQLYSVIDALLICCLLLTYEPFQRRDGELLAIMLTIYPITRFLIEIIRIDEGPVFGTGMSISQNISLLILLVVAGLWLYIYRRPPGRAWSMRV